MKKLVIALIKKTGTAEKEKQLHAYTRRTQSASGELPLGQ